MYCILISLRSKSRKREKSFIGKINKFKSNSLNVHFGAIALLGVTRRQIGGPFCSGLGWLRDSCEIFEKLIGGRGRVIFYKLSYSLQYCPRVQDLDPISTTIVWQLGSPLPPPCHTQREGSLKVPCQTVGQSWRV